MSVLYDLDHYWGNDLSSNASGDLATVFGTIRGQQRILRRLLTNPGGYKFHANKKTGDVYGGGLAQALGSPIDVEKLQAVIRSQLKLEAVVSQTPTPVINLTQNINDYTAFDVSIAYNDANTNTMVVLTFTVSA